MNPSTNHDLAAERIENRGAVQPALTGSARGDVSDDNSFGWIRWNLRLTRPSAVASPRSRLIRTGPVGPQMSTGVIKRVTVRGPWGRNWVRVFGVRLCLY